jgi:hypothetical protein
MEFGFIDELRDDVSVVGVQILYAYSGVVEVSCFRASSEIQSRIARQKFGTQIME